MVLQFILGLQSQSIFFANAFAQADIPSGYPVLVEPPRNFKSDGLQCDVVLILNKSVYSQSEAARIWFERLQNGLLDRYFVVRNEDTCMFMSKTGIFVAYVHGYLFWANSQSDIDNSMKYFKEDGTSCNWGISRGELLIEFLSIYIKTLDYGGFKF